MKTINRYLAIGLLLTISSSIALAQTSKKEIFGDIYRTGSNYFAYPGPKAKALTKAPEGYVPFILVTTVDMVRAICRTTSIT